MYRAPHLIDSSILSSFSDVTIGEQPSPSAVTRTIANWQLGSPNFVVCLKRVVDGTKNKWDGCVA